ncbi:MAG: hypothetical protein ACPGVN_07815, partial [Alphaproteobacteria bacterium]
KLVTLELDKRAFDASSTMITDRFNQAIGPVWQLLQENGPSVVRVVYNTTEGEKRALGIKRAETVAKFIRIMWNRKSKRNRGANRYELAKSQVEMEVIDRQAGKLVLTHVGANTEQLLTRDPTLPMSAVKDAYGISAFGSPSFVKISNHNLDLTPGSRTSQSDQRESDRVLANQNLEVRFDGFELNRRLNVTARVEKSERGRVVRITPYWNYGHWVDKAEVRIFDASQDGKGTPRDIIQQPEDDLIRLQIKPEARGEMFFTLRVYDKQGKFDETSLQKVMVGEPSFDFDATIVDAKDKPDMRGYGKSALATAGIRLNGGTITIAGRGLEKGSRVYVLGAQIPTNASGGFVVEQIMPVGIHDIDVVPVFPNGSRYEITRRVEVDANEVFMVGIAEATFGHSVVKTDAGSYNETITEGRVAFYLRGKVKGDILLTAMADTGEGDLEDIFTTLHKTDPKALIRRIDPDKYYPIYGDNSEITEDAPTNGKFYVRVERDESYGLIGNYKTDLNVGESIKVNRGLYGAKVNIREGGETKFGDNRIQVTAYGALPETVHSTDILQGTGGSLYYLMHRDIVIGSETVTLQVRDNFSGLVISEQQLEFEDDYSIDAFNGRITLNRPLASTVEDDSIFTDGSLQGHGAFLVIDYDYVAGTDTSSGHMLGGSAAVWLGDHIELGVAAVSDKAGSSTHQVTAGHATIQITPESKVQFEVAYSKGQAGGQNTSADGGFQYNQIPSAGNSGGAMMYAVEAETNLGSVTNNAVKGTAKAYARQYGAGFKAAGSEGQVAVSTTKWGLEVNAAPNDKVNARLSYDHENNAVGLKRDRIEGEVEVEIVEDIKLTVGAAHEMSSTQANKTEIAGKIGYENEAGNALYAFAKGTMQQGTSGFADQRFGVGAKYNIAERLALGGEISHAKSSGIEAKAEATYKLSEIGSLYTSYAAKQGGEGQLTFGAKRRFGDKATLFGEERLIHQSRNMTGLTHAMGIEYAPSQNWNFSVSGEMGKVSALTRRAIAASVAYNNRSVQASAGAEWRTEKDAVGVERTSVLGRAKAKFELNKDFSFKTNLSVAHSASNQSPNGNDNGEFVEGSVGLAYRPVASDKLNALIRYTFLHDLPPSAQVNAFGSTTGFKQRSHMMSADVNLAVNHWLTLGAKYGLKISEQTATRTDNNWFSNQVHLAVLRGDVHFLRKWDALLEARMIKMGAADQIKFGGLAGVYRHINENAKVGVGYNFS